MSKTQLTQTEKYMKLALLQARKCLAQDEVPVGAVIISKGAVVAYGRNTRAKKGDVFGHAECNAISKASKRLKDWRLNDCEMYVTLEPCAMCLGAAVNARIAKVVFGAYDSASGCCGSAFDLSNYCMNHTTIIEGGVLEQECSELLKDYFRAKRQSAKEKSRLATHNQQESVTKSHT